MSARGGEKSLVLVVDDTDTSRYAKSRLLRQAGFEVLEASSGTEALRAVKESKPRLVLLDVRLPDVDGWEVCRRLKSDPDTASVLVLQVSATYVEAEDTVRALEGGADGCLTEPVEPPVLIATVRALLRARAAEDALRDALASEQAARNVAEAANRTKDEFLATLSHELRSPLGAILTWVTMLRAGQLDESRIARALEAIERNTRLQIKLIEDLLDVSRIIAGKMRLERSLVDIGAIIEAALDTVRPAAEAKAIRLEAMIDPTLGPLTADPARLQQVIWNLLSNAVKFTPKGGRVDIRFDALDSSARISVSDTGKGIPADILPHVFERFRQADSSTTRREGGLGLGLAIVRHLVELHGGSVEAESRGEGAGAVFTVKLPLPAVRSALDAAHVRLPPVRLPRLEKLRVLVLDDERDARDAITAVLEGSGATVEAVASVAEALALLERSMADVVLSDIAMPGQDGFSFVRELRARKGSEVPALALTAYAGSEEQRRILSAGFAGYLTKPIEATELLTAVAKLASKPERS